MTVESHRKRTGKERQSDDNTWPILGFFGSFFQEDNGSMNLQDDNIFDTC